MVLERVVQIKSIGGLALLFLRLGEIMYCIELKEADGFRMEYLNGGLIEE